MVVEAVERNNTVPVACFKHGTKQSRATIEHVFLKRAHPRALASRGLRTGERSHDTHDTQMQHTLYTVLVLGPVFCIFLSLR